MIQSLSFSLQRKCIKKDNIQKDVKNQGMNKTLITGLIKMIFLVSVSELQGQEKGHIPFF